MFLADFAAFESNTTATFNIDIDRSDSGMTGQINVRWWPVFDGGTTYGYLCTNSWSGNTNTSTSGSKNLSLFRDDVRYYAYTIEFKPVYTTTNAYDSYYTINPPTITFA